MTIFFKVASSLFRRDIRHLDNHLDRTEETLHALTILVKRLVKGNLGEASAAAGGESILKRYQGIFVLLAGQAGLLAIYVLFKGATRSPQRKAL